MISKNLFNVGIDEEYQYEGFNLKRKFKNKNYRLLNDTVRKRAQFGKRR